LTVLEHCPDDVPLRQLVERSLRQWQFTHLRDGLLRDVPGWHFTDWDALNEEAGRQATRGAHAVVNAWYFETCQRLGFPSIDLAAFDVTFWVEEAKAYRLTEKGEPSPHATAAALTSIPGTRGLDYLITCKELPQRVTPYFGYFVTRAIGNASQRQMLDFVRSFYGPTAVQHGTLVEKTDDRASLAHGWSVGIAALLPLVSDATEV
jgi:hypothetical protein